MNIAYVNTAKNEARQLDALEKYEIERWFYESSTDYTRPKLEKMLNVAREGDTVYILDFSKLARCGGDFYSIYKRLKEKKINLISLKEKFDGSSLNAELRITIMGLTNCPYDKLDAYKRW